MGQLALGYAEEIFSLGTEFIHAVKQQDPSRKRPLRLAIGVEDSFPKLLSYEILKPVLSLEPPVQLVCREGKADELLARLAVYRLEAILADEPATGGIKFKVFSHRLGKSAVAICAKPPLARTLRNGFPRSLVFA